MYYFMVNGSRAGWYLRKVQVVGDDFEEGVGPISTASVIATNLEDHLDKVLTGLIQS